MEGEPEARGVHNPKVIDLISRDAASGAAVLSMIETRPWGAAPDQIKQIEDKFNSYLGYAKGGMLEREYPQYAGAPLVFRLECAEAPGRREDAFLTAIAGFAAEEGVRFEVAVTAVD